MIRLITLAGLFLLALLLLLLSIFGLGCVRYEKQSVRVRDHEGLFTVDKYFPVSCDVPLHTICLAGVIIFSVLTLTMLIVICINHEYISDFFEGIDDTYQG